MILKCTGKSTCKLKDTGLDIENCLKKKNRIVKVGRVILQKDKSEFLPSRLWLSCWTLERIEDMAGVSGFTSSSATLKRVLAGDFVGSRFSSPPAANRLFFNTFSSSGKHYVS